MKFIQAKRSFNTSKEFKQKCRIYDLSNHVKKDWKYNNYDCKNCSSKGCLLFKKMVKKIRKIKIVK